MNDEIMINEEKILPVGEPQEELTDADEVITEYDLDEEEKELPLTVPEEKSTSKETENVRDEETVESLKKELEDMRRELDEKRSAFERMSRELGEFSALFPNQNPSNIPDSVWESVRAGIPLAAAYALYEKKALSRLEAAAKINQKNGAASTGALGREITESFFTPDEVRAMSRDEVRTNYKKILDSMKKWN